MKKQRIFNYCNTFLKNVVHEHRLGLYFCSFLAKKLLSVFCLGLVKFFVGDTHKVGDNGVWKFFLRMSWSSRKNREVSVKSLPKKNEKKSAKEIEVLSVVSSIRWQWYTIQSPWTWKRKKMNALVLWNSKYSEISPAFFRQSFGMVDFNIVLLLQRGFFPLHRTWTNERASFFVGVVGKKPGFRMILQKRPRRQKRFGRHFLQSICFYFVLMCVCEKCTVAPRRL